MKKLIFLILLLLVVVIIVYALTSEKNQEQKQTISFEDGTYLGYIHTVQTGDDMQVAFDDAIWLSGKEGEDAAIEAGLCDEQTRSECLPNDYFIKNIEKVDEYLPLDKNVLIFMQTWEAGEQGILEKEISLDNFSDLINDPSLHWSKLPYNISIKNNKIVRIEEVYIP